MKTKRKNNHLWIKIFISVIAIVLVVVHLVWPDIKVDAITLGLIIVAILPWLSSVVESLKFPGGWEITFRDVEEASSKILENNPTMSSVAKELPAYLEVSTSDPNLALVGLRIEIEKRLRKLAELNNVPDWERRSLTHLSSRLGNRNVLDESTISGLQSIVGWGNSAAHGAKVEKEVTDWAFDQGPKILSVLDAKLEQQK